MSSTTLPNRAARHDPVKAREAFAAKFSSPEERSAYYRGLAARSNAGRLTLAAEDANTLRAAYLLLTQIAQRHGFDPAAPVEVSGDA